MNKPQSSIIFVVLLTAAIAFFCGKLMGMDLPIYLYIIIAGFGFLLHAVILIVLSDGEREYEETTIKGRAK
ncbi:MAG: hypothetical protein ABS882_12985 [Lysinibacillus sp.]